MMRFRGPYQPSRPIAGPASLLVYTLTRGFRCATVRGWEPLMFRSGTSVCGVELSVSYGVVLGP